MSLTFSPITLPTVSGPGLTLKNRLFIAPMCQYSVFNEDGTPTPWHLQHYGAYAAGGFSLITVEATGVVPEGRITPRCLGLYSDSNEAEHARIVELIHTLGASAALQIGHAGGKASTYPPFGFTLSGTVAQEEGGWEPVGPQSVPVYPGLTPALELDPAGIQHVIQGFVDAAIRADRAGYDALQIHAAHGYLLHQFLSPITSTRTDEYGGSSANRARLLIEVTAAVRQVWPANKVLGIRVSATDWSEAGVDVNTTAAVLRTLAQEHGVTWVDVSSGGLVGGKNIPTGPGYQVHLAHELKEKLSDLDVVVSAVGLIDCAVQAETILATEQADAISIGRAALRNPHWASQVAVELRVDNYTDFMAPQHLRANW